MNEKQKAKIEKSKYIFYIQECSILINENERFLYCFISTGPLYQDLPNNVIAVTDSRHSYHDIKDFISNILPASDAHHVTQDLHKKVHIIIILPVCHECDR